MIHLGDVAASSTLYIPFATYGGATGASITLTGLAVTDIEIYKNGSVTQRSSDSGYALLDTDGIDFDGITGIHGFSIDLSDNTDASFYAVGSFYWVVVSAVTVDGQTVNFIAATFRIRAAEAIAGKPKVDVDGWLGTAAATPTTAGVPEVDVTHWIGTAAATPTTAGVPEVDVTYWLGSAVATPSVAGVPEVDVTHIVGGAASTPATVDANVVSMEADTIDRAAFAADTGLKSIRSNTAQAGGSDTITLDTSASATEGFYDGLWILITGGTGAGQVRMVDGYVGATRVATVATAWITNPDNTSTFALLPASRVDVNGMDVGLLTDIGTYVWATTVRQLTGTQTFSLTGNITGNLSGSVGSVTGGINTAAGVIQTLDALDTAQDIEHDATQATLATITGYLNTEIADILEDTGTTIPAQIAALNNLSAAQVNTEVDTALADINLDHLVKSAVDTNFATTVHLDSVVGHLADAGTTATFDRTTDALEVLAGSSAPSAATIADAVCDELLSGHTTSGSLSWYIDAIKDQTDLITSTQLTVASPFENTSLTIKQGDTYSVAAGQTLTVTEPAGANWPDDLTSSWTVTFNASVISSRTAAATAAGATATLTKTCVVTGASSVRIDLTAANTTGLYVGANVWEWELEAVHLTNGTNTLISGVMTVVDDV
jgi:hypothetical protein